MHCIWNAALNKLMHATWLACALCAISPSVALAGWDGNERQRTATQWRTGNLLVSESAADADGWLTLACQGGGCVALLNAIENKLPAKERRRVDGRLQVFAVPWHELALGHYGPLRVESGGDLKATQSPWLDARYAAAECRWQDGDAGSHRIELAGGPAADYIGPDGSVRRLKLDHDHSSACNRCRGMPAIDLFWHDPGKPDAGTLFLRIQNFGDKEQMSGYAHWPNQQGVQITCSLRQS